MGFKFKRINFVGGSTDWPTGDSYANRRLRSENLVKAVAQAIINSGCGWTLDISKNATVTSYVDIPSKTNGEPFPGLFLVNSSSGCKLFVCNFATKNQLGIVDFSGTGASIFRLNNTTDRYTSGLCMSIIPDNSNSTFGDPTTTTFLPSDATRIVGTVNCYTNTNDYGSYAYNPQSGYVYSWGLFVNEFSIVVTTLRANGSAPSLGTPVYGIGKLIGTLVNSEDSYAYSKYCILYFMMTGVYYEGTAPVIRTANYAGSGVSKYFIGSLTTASSSISYFTNSPMGSVFNSAGTWIDGTDGTNYAVTIYPVDVFQLSPYVLLPLNGDKSRWCPFAISVMATDLSTYGVVSGNGMKGYLDTDLFRCALGIYGKQYDNGNFICCDDNNFLIGWDPTNTDQIAGT